VVTVYERERPAGAAGRSRERARAQGWRECSETIRCDAVSAAAGSTPPAVTPTPTLSSLRVDVNTLEHAPTC
jgi:hypothetical protein